jgi:integron integrase
MNTPTLPEKTTSPNPPKLLDQVVAKIRFKHYSRRTELTYAHWIKRYILFHGKRHPKEMGAPEIEAFLSALATDRNVSASTQNLALSSLLFLYKEVLEIDLPWLDNIIRAKKPQRLPTVLSEAEVKRLLACMEGVSGLVARLLYGTGMRLLEALKLRVKDIDFDRREILVRDGKGAKDRVTMLPESLTPALKEHLARRRAIFDADVAAGQVDVWMPDALERKYPNVHECMPPMMYDLHVSLSPTLSRKRAREQANRYANLTLLPAANGVGNFSSLRTMCPPIRFRASSESIIRMRR